MPVRDDQRAQVGALGLSAIVFVLMVCASLPASAQDGVWVSFHGGTQRADAFDLFEQDEQWEVRPRGQRQLLSADIGLQVVNDLKILPDGSNLLAGVGGRGAVITAGDGQPEFIFAPPDSYPRSSSASVMVYAAPGDPGRILMTDSNTSRLLLIEPEDRQIVWQTGFQLPGSAGLFADAIAMPDNRVAAGIEYTSLGISGLDILEFTPGPTGTLVRRLTNRQHANGPANQVTVDGLHPLKDFLGLPNGNLLVATDEQLLEVSVEGTVQWVTQLSGRAEIQGDISSVALMPSGRVAITTLEPGQWTRPHPNHRVHWLERGPLESGDVELVATSEPLRRAPSNLETRGGHGASGTFGYRPGLDNQSQGDLSDLGVARPLSFSSETFTPRDSIGGSILVRNEGEDSIYIADIQVRAVLGECGGSTDAAPVELFNGRFIELAPESLFDLRGGFDADGQLPLGRWCAQTYATDGDSEPVEIGDPAYFEIVERSADGGGTVVVRDVGFWEADAFDAGSDSRPPVDRPGGDCCSHSVHDRAPVPHVLLICALAFGTALLRRRTMNG